MRDEFFSVMKFRDLLTFALLVFLVTLQVVLFRRVASLESALKARPGGEAIDRRLASIRRTVETLAAGGRKERARESAPRAAGAAAELAAAKGPAAVAAGRPQAAANESPGLDDDEATPPEPLGQAAPSLARRKQILEDLRARLGQIDTDLDSEVSLKEFPGDVADFLYFDRNSSGDISIDEIQRVIAVEEKAVQRVAAGDRDGDGVLGPGELRGSPRRFRFLDENEDGFVSPDELVAEHRRVNDRLVSDDVNRDHKIAPAEFSGGPAKFEKYDKNKDGFIDRSELKELLIHSRQ